MENQDRNDHGVPISYTVLGIEAGAGFDASVRSFASNIDFDAGGVDLTLDGSERTNVRNGFAHYSGFPASNTPSQVPTSQRRRFVILDGREGPNQWQLLYSADDFHSSEAATVRAVIDSVGPVAPPAVEYTITVAKSPESAGAISGSGVYAENSEVPLTASPNAGYRFGQWVGEGVADLSSPTTTVLADSDKTVTAMFIRIWQATVNASPTDGGSVSEGGVFDEGSVITLEAAPAEGYRFSHWSGADVADQEMATTTAVLTNEQTFTANFIKVRNLSVSASPLDGGTTNAGGVFDENAVVAIIATPNEGYRFSHWSGDGIADPSMAATQVTITVDQEVTANFVKVWGLEVSSARIDGGTVTGTGIYDRGAEAAITAMPAEGYRFAGWQGEGVADPAAATTTVMVTADRQVTATFVRVWTLNLASTDAEGGSVSEGGVFDDGSEVVITAIASEGYRFAGWSGEGVADPTAMMTTVTLTADRMLEARFIKTWMVTLTNAPQAGGTVSAGGVVDDGVAFPITATPNEGYRFAGWTGADVADELLASTSLTVASDVSLTAHFVKVSSFQVLASPANGGTVSGGGDHDAGAVVSITATPSDGYRFDRWEGADVAEPTSAATTITVGDATTVTAIFVRQWQLTLTASPSEGGSVSGAGTFDEGTEVTISAEPAEGYRFVGWIGSEAVSNPNLASTNLTLNASTEVTARFVQLSDDEDADGLNDIWERENGLDPANPNDANLDADRDGETNIEEFRARTDPQDPQSRLHVINVWTDGEVLNLVWQSVPGVSYAIEGTADLDTAWVRLDIGTVIAEASESQVNLSLDMPFVRVVAVSSDEL